MNKKGVALTDYLVYIGVFFLIAFLLPIGYIFVKSINDSVQTPTISTQLGTASTTIFSKLENRYHRFGDAFIVFMLFLFSLGLMVSAFYSSTKPGYFLFFLIPMFIILVVSVYMANAYYDASTTSGLASYFSAFPMTQVVIRRWIIFASVLIIGVIFALFARKGGQGL